MFLLFFVNLVDNRFDFPKVEVGFLLGFVDNRLDFPKDKVSRSNQKQSKKKLSPLPFETTTWELIKRSSTWETEWEIVPHHLGARNIDQALHGEPPVHNTRSHQAMGKIMVVAPSV